MLARKRYLNDVRMALEGTYMYVVAHIFPKEASHSGKRFVMAQLDYTCSSTSFLGNFALQFSK